MKDGKFLNEDFALCCRVDWVRLGPSEGVVVLLQNPIGSFSKIWLQPPVEEAGCCLCWTRWFQNPYWIQVQLSSHRLIKMHWGYTLSLSQASVIYSWLLLLWCSCVQKLVRMIIEGKLYSNSRVKVPSLTLFLLQVKNI